MAEQQQTRAGGGRFISFEGGEGAGKSTQIKLLAQRLEAAGLRTKITREPGGSPGAEIIRHLLLSGIGALIGGAPAETLLFAAARDDHVQTVIAPALAGATGCCATAFRIRRGPIREGSAPVPPALLNALERVTIDGLKPDLTIILDVPVETGVRRAAVRRGEATPDRFEAEGLEFHRGLREAYRQIAADNPARCVLIDADAALETVAERVWSTVRQRLLAAPIGDMQPA